MLPTAIEHALIIRVPDRSLQAYIQQYPFFTGPNEVMNRRCFAAATSGVELRKSLSIRTPEPLEPSMFFEEPAIRSSARTVMSLAGLATHDADIRLESRAWKVCLVPQEARTVLALGCGEGDEIAALRARLPKAELLGLDWTNKVSPGLLEAAAASFEYGDFNELLARKKGEFDAVFSNHVIEHSFEPSELLNAIHQALRPRGWLISALPLDGESGNPVYQELLLLLNKCQGLERVDSLLLAAGHPYKTNASELCDRLVAAGFKLARVMYRPWQPTLFNSVDARSLDLRRTAHMKVYRRTLGLLNSSLRAALGAEMPLKLLRLLAAIDSRAPFGIIRMHTHLSREGIVVAQRS
jgi:SAM-dependent methyltransferase